MQAAASILAPNPQPDLTGSEVNNLILEITAEGSACACIMLSARHIVNICHIRPADLVAFWKSLQHGATPSEVDAKPICSELYHRGPTKQHMHQSLARHMSYCVTFACIC